MGKDESKVFPRITFPEAQRGIETVPCLRNFKKIVDRGGPSIQIQSSTSVGSSNLAAQCVAIDTEVKSALDITNRKYIPALSTGYKCNQRNR